MAASSGSAAPSPSGGDPFEALGDPNRRAIVELLAPGGRSVQEIADALPISRPAVSRHLRLLKQAGLVREEPVGTRRIYRLHDEGIEAVRAYLERVWGDAATRFSLLASNTAPPPAAPGPVAGRDRADPARVRRRLPGRSRVRGLDGPDRHLVADRPHRLGRRRDARRPRGPARRPDLRADAERRRARLGRGHGLGAAVAPGLPLASPARPRRRDGGRDPVRGRRRGDDAGRDRAPRLGAAGERAARSSGTAIAVAGRRSCRTTSPRPRARSASRRRSPRSPQPSSSERLRDVAREDAAPLAGQLPGDDGIVCDQPGEVAQPVLHDLLVGDVARRGGRLRAGEVRPADRGGVEGTRELRVDHDDEAEDHRVPVASPRGRMDEPRRPDDITHDPVDDLDRVIGRTQLEQPRHRPVRPGQLEVVAVQPDDEDLGLDGTLDVEARRKVRHRGIVPAKIASALQPTFGVDNSACSRTAVRTVRSGSVVP